MQGSRVHHPSHIDPLIPVRPVLHDVVVGAVTVVLVTSALAEDGGFSSEAPHRVGLVGQAGDVGSGGRLLLPAGFAILALGVGAALGAHC